MLDRLTFNEPGHDEPHDLTGLCILQERAWPGGDRQQLGVGQARHHGQLFDGSGRGRFVINLSDAIGTARQRVNRPFATRS